MDTLRDPRPDLADLAPYASKEVRAEVMLASNENPADLPPEIVAKIAERMRGFGFNRYPDPMATEVRELIAAANGLDVGNVLLGNGGDELIFDLVLAWGGSGRTVVDLPPTFVMYGLDARMTGTNLVAVPRTETFDLDAEAVLAELAGGGADIVTIANPNNPTGNLTAETALIDILNATDGLVLVDEAYFEFSRHTMRPHMARHPNLVILRTFSKAFSLAGLRVGYLLAHEDVVGELTKVRQPYSVDRFSQMVASLVFRERAQFERGIAEIIRGRDHVFSALSAMPNVIAFPSEANFVMFRTAHAGSVWRDLLHNHGILVRDFSRTPHLQDCLRVTIGTEAENARFLEAMNDILVRRDAAEAVRTGQPGD
jgi:histidinol-phosphate aminotransferase